MLGFPQIDVEELKRDLKVQEQAFLEAREGRPLQTDTKLDRVQQGIVHVMGEKLEEARTRTFEALQHHERDRNEIELEMDLSKCEAIPGGAQQGINRALDKRRDGLVGLRKHERNRLRQRNYFVASNKLDREPDYPDSHIFHWALVIVAILAESLANSYFFAKGSDFGLLGGTFQALLISAANIGTALMIGVYATPYVNHIKPARRLAAAGGVSAYSLVVVVFNLATAHYRAQLELDPFNALVKAIPSLLEDPFGVRNYDAWVLFIIGLLFATFALIKGYTSDDPYPGYGKVDRAYKAARDEYDEAKQGLKNEINAVIDEKAVELDRLVRHLRRNAQRYGALITQSETFLQEFAHYADFAEESANTLLREFRDHNANVRADKPPPYFKNAYSFEDTKALPPLDLAEERETSERFEALIAKLDEMAGHLHKELRRLNDSTIESMKTFFLKIEEEAERRLGEDEIK